MLSEGSENATATEKDFLDNSRFNTFEGCVVAKGCATRRLLTIASGSDGERDEDGCSVPEVVGPSTIVAGLLLPLLSVANFPLLKELNIAGCDPDRLRLSEELKTQLTRLIF